MQYVQNYFYLSYVLNIEKKEDRFLFIKFKF